MSYSKQIDGIGCLHGLSEDQNQLKVKIKYLSDETNIDMWADCQVPKEWRKYIISLNQAILKGHKVIISFTVSFKDIYERVCCTKADPAKIVKIQGEMKNLNLIFINGIEYSKKEVLKKAFN